MRIVIDDIKESLAPNFKGGEKALQAGLILTERTR